MVKSALLLLGFLAIFTAVFALHSAGLKSTSPNQVFASAQREMEPKDFGSGVWGFETTDHDAYARSLATFIRRHNNLRVTSQTSYSYSSGYTCGFIITTEKK